MQIPTNLNLRQTLEGMTLTFDPTAAEGLAATIQFDVTGPEPGVYHLRIADGECTFHPGPAAAPALTITTPSDVWLQISSGQLSGQEALMQGLYTADGDLSLLLKMDSLFKPSDQVSFEAPSGQRPAGPIPLPGMAWMTVAFLPWIVHWVTFDIPGVSHWISVGLPLLLSALIVGYRLAFNKPTWMEWGGLGFFSLAGILTLTGDVGFAAWGSVISSVVMSSLWLGTLLFSDMPLSGDYSKWDYVKALWRNSMFIYPNAVISLMWGWQFIAAALLGVAAILLPNLMVVFTVLRYLLLVPAFIFTSVYQKRATQLRVSDYDKTLARLRFWAGMGLSAVSGLLLAAAIPYFDVGLLGWIALAPLLATLTVAPAKQRSWLALPFGLVWSIAAHNWFPGIFSPTLGKFLIFAVGAFYATVIQWGTFLQRRLPKAIRVLALPVTWAAVEFIRFIAPVVEDWWMMLLAKSQWRFPPALQVLSLTGFPGLSFLVMLANVAIAFLLLWAVKSASQQKGKWANGLPPVWVNVTALVVVAAVVGWGALSIPSTPPQETFTILSTTDMTIQDPDIPGLIKSSDIQERLNNPERSQAMFDVNESLTRQAVAAGASPAFVVWPENKMATADDAAIISQLSALAQDVNAYIVVNLDEVLPQEKFHVIALMVGPDGQEIGRRAKIHLFSSDASKYGFPAAPRSYPVFDTPYGKVGLAVCKDSHYFDVTGGLARNGARLLLMPTDDDLNGNAWFPHYHASDGVFRAVEHRAAFVSSTTNGVSIIVDPYGRIVAESDVNERGVIVGEVFIAPGQTLYTHWGDWFGWLMVAGMAVFFGLATLNNRKGRK